jgi:cell division topological specificity factor
MDWMSFFRTKKPASASTARDRLMVAVAWQRDQDGRNATDDGPSYLPQMRDEILEVIRKYVQVADSAVKVNVQREDGLDVLEMNITLPDSKAG